MNRFEYFIYAIKNQLHYDRMWLKRALMIPYGTTDPKDCGLGNDGKHYIAIIDGTPTEIEQVVANTPLFGIKENITLVNNVLPNVPTTIVTNIGQVLINEYFFAYAFGSKIPFVQGKITAKVIDSIITPKLVNKEITVDEYFKYFEGANFSTVFNEISIVASSKKAITASKVVTELRDKLLAENKDKLNDPQVAAMIDEAIGQADREYMKGDVAEDWFVEGKMYDVVRKKLFALQGGIEKLTGDGYDYVATSLADGYNAQDLPAIINQLRSGSYDRGASTALGGYYAEVMSRIFQTTTVAEQDCGVDIGKRELIKDNSTFVGRYLVGSHDPLDAATLSGLIGKSVIMRDATACKTPGGNVCGVCMGTLEADSKIGLAPRFMGMGNVFLKISLAAFHGKASKTVLIDPLSELH